MLALQSGPALVFNTKLHYASILALQSGPALVFNTKLHYASILALQSGPALVFNTKLHYAGTAKQNVESSVADPTAAACGTTWMNKHQAQHIHGIMGTAVSESNLFVIDYSEAKLPPPPPPFF